MPNEAKSAFRWYDRFDRIVNVPPTIAGVVAFAGSQSFQTGVIWTGRVFVCLAFFAAGSALAALTRNGFFVVAGAAAALAQLGVSLPTLYGGRPQGVGHQTYLVVGYLAIAAMLALSIACLVARKRMSAIVQYVFQVGDDRPESWSAALGRAPAQPTQPAAQESPAAQPPPRQPKPRMHHQHKSEAFITWALPRPNPIRPRPHARHPSARRHPHQNPRCSCAARSAARRTQCVKPTARSSGAAAASSATAWRLLIGSAEGAAGLRDPQPRADPIGLQPTPVTQQRGDDRVCGVPVGLLVSRPASTSRPSRAT
jgi:hypothetical protein